MGREYSQKLDGYKQGTIVKSRKNLSKFRKYMAYMKVKTVLDAPDHLLTMNRTFAHPEYESALGNRKLKNNELLQGVRSKA